MADHQSIASYLKQRLKLDENEKINPETLGGLFEILEQNKIAVAKQLEHLIKSGGTLVPVFSETLSTSNKKYNELISTLRNDLTKDNPVISFNDLVNNYKEIRAVDLIKGVTEKLRNKEGLNSDNATLLSDANLAANMFSAAEFIGEGDASFAKGLKQEAHNLADNLHKI